MSIETVIDGLVSNRFATDRALEAYADSTLGHHRATDLCDWCNTAAVRRVADTDRRTGEVTVVAACYAHLNAYDAVVNRDRVRDQRLSLAISDAITAEGWTTVRDDGFQFQQYRRLLTEEVTP